MEGLISASQRSPKQSKAKKRPIKVVYISNPMRVETSAAEFRAIVQELTGRHSDVADNMAKYHGVGNPHPVQVATIEEDVEGVVFDEALLASLPAVLDMDHFSAGLMPPLDLYDYNQGFVFQGFE